MSWLITIAVLVLIGFILDREIYFYEGAHLGPRVQSWLYDRWSKKYDAGKRESQLRDSEMLVQPLLDVLKNVSEPFVLDFATGTGRLSYALTSHPDFKGRIIALDFSQGMLEQAASKLTRASSSEQNGAARRAPLSAKVDERVELLRHLSLPLPFPDATFDVVCALEVLELFPNMEEPLAEFSRVLRPGGILLTSRGTEESGRKAKVKSKSDFGLLLTKNDFANFQIAPWWKLFDRVITIKNGSSHPVGGRKLTDVMLCAVCEQTQWERKASTLRCKSCGKEMPVTKEGIVLN
ncbi:MAG: class I SAM-dependent methyltransferase [Anaerolineae bacterium]|nr:class I SAM-dependent methyltransferase [Anaerolineae bacterium]MCI0610043.1 class I SAM-dependent methyltransferase [Anaerolineae bacterium]